MTGFGRGSAAEGNTEVNVEIRSVNSRYAEISIRAPRSVTALEQDIQSAIKKRVERGRITVQIEVAEASDASSNIKLNTDAVRGYRQLLDSLRNEAGIENEIGVEHILHFSDVFIREVIDEEAEARRGALVMSALDEAIDGIVRMRNREGKALEEELENRLLLMEQMLARIDERAPRRVDEARTRLRDRVREILDDERVDADRLELEIVLLADRLDVTEESVRLKSHIAQFREALVDDESVGRKLNFISQEMNREVNTIGSKANDPEIARLVVTMKEELEKIREQIQNVE